MNKYNTILDGKLVAQTFSAEGGYDYVIYASGKGQTGLYSWAVMRLTIASNLYEYAHGTSSQKELATVITNRATLVYAPMYQIKTNQ